METHLTLNTALEKIGFGKFHFCLTILVCCVIFIQSWLINEFLLFNVGLIIFEEGEKQNWTNSERGMVGSCHMIGQMISTVIIGNISDRKGRTFIYKKTIWIALIGVILVFSSSNIYLFGSFFMITGMGAGSEIAVSSVIYLEYLPESKHSYEFLMSAFWSGGGAFQAICTLLFMNIDTGLATWRCCLIVILVIILVFGIAREWLPETPQYLLANFKTKEAEKVLKTIEKFNKKETLEIKLLEERLVEKTDENENEFFELWKNNYLKISVLATFIYSTYSMITVFIDLFMQEILSELGLDWNEIYFFIFLQQFGASLSQFFVEYLVDSCLGRKYTFFLAAFISGIFNICYISGVNKWINLAFSCASTIFNMSGWTALYILIQETYETKVRNSAVGWGTSCEAIGGITGPLVGGYLMSLHNGHTIALSVMIGFGIAVGLSSLIFKETRGRLV